MANAREVHSKCCATFFFHMPVLNKLKAKAPRFHISTACSSPLPPHAMPSLMFVSVGRGGKRERLQLTARKRLSWIRSLSFVTQRGSPGRSRVGRQLQTELRVIPCSKTLCHLLFSVEMQLNPSAAPLLEVTIGVSRRGSPPIQRSRPRRCCCRRRQHRLIKNQDGIRKNIE